VRGDIDIEAEDELLDALQQPVQPAFHIPFFRLLRDDMRMRVWFVEQVQEISGPFKSEQSVRLMQDLEEQVISVIEEDVK
jgi:hypothetical protein